jgi:hypothetical protein
MQSNFESMQAISWQVEGRVKESWGRWLEDLFERCCSHICGECSLSARQSAREIIVLDARVDRPAEARAGQSSIEAGNSCCRKHAEANG